MIPIIYDGENGEGINLEFNMENGMAITLFLDDKAAQDLINIMQNKLDGHWK
jgi:hypothetical protein